MTREFLITELLRRNIHAEPTTVLKNGAVFHGIMIGNGDIRPTIYEEQYKNVDRSKIELVIDKVRQMLADVPNFDIKNYINWEWAKTRLSLCLQQKTEEDLCKRNFLDMEQYVRVIVDKEQNASFKVGPKMLEIYGIDEDTLFNEAINCTRPFVYITDMKDIKLSNNDISVKNLFEIPEQTMLIATNKSGVNGASTICFSDVLSEIAEKYDSSYIIIPSSIHECLFFLWEDVYSVDNFSKMIQEINQTHINPEEVLDNHAYYYDKNMKKIFSSVKEYEEYKNAR